MNKCYSVIFEPSDSHSMGGMKVSGIVHIDAPSEESARSNLIHRFGKKNIKITDVRSCSVAEIARKHGGYATKPYKRSPG